MESFSFNIFPKEVFHSKGAAIKFFLCKVFHVFKFLWLE